MTNKNLPNHIAFIMDGNRRWAVEHGMKKMDGHTQGLENMKKIVRSCADLGIKNITFWALSTDNLKKRDKGELQHLFKLLGEIREFLFDLVEMDAKVQYIGDLSKLPAWLRSILEDVEEKTAKHKKVVLTLAINYGGKDEIIRMAKEVTAKTKSSSQVSQKVIDSIIDSGNLPPVDMIVRTGGHKRLSGFLPWIGDYAELYFTNVKWPAFTTRQLSKALTWYEQQERNFGK